MVQLRVFNTSLFLILLLSGIITGAHIAEFRGEASRDKVFLIWNSLIVEDIKGFEIERGHNNKDFNKIDFVKASHQTTFRTEYTYADTSNFQANERVYYRLKILTKDESFTYSKTIKINQTMMGAGITWDSIRAMFR